METIIRRRLATDAELCAHLAVYGSDAAIFYRKAPADTDSPESFYPHVVLNVDRYSDPQKGVAGMLNVDIICTQVTEPPEDFERIIRRRLEGVFMRPTDGEIFSLKWQRTDVFTELEREKTPLIIGASMTFELYEFPLVETSEPDPIAALNAWASQFGVAIIGITEFSDFLEPTRERPAIYFDVQKIRLGEQHSTATFVSATVNLHVFAPDVRTRRQWLTIINQQLIMERIICTADGARLMLEDFEYLWAASEVQGQIQYKFTFGITREYPYAHPLIGKEVSFDSNVRWQHVHNQRIH